jgi:hypothetical protein
MAGKPRGEDMLLQQIPLPPKPTQDMIDRARLTVCSNATDAGEARTMLSMLGLL